MASANIQYQIQALSEAFNYGDAGLDLVIDALSNYKREVRKNAYQLLQQREEVKAKDAVKNDKFWSDFEYLNRLPHSHAEIFAHRKVENFNPEIGISDSANMAYALRVDPYEDDPKFQERFESLIKHERASQLEALVLCYWGYKYNDSVMNMLVDASTRINNLRALFIGDIQDEENMISSIELGDVNPILGKHTNLEILHIRGGRNLRFSSGYLEDV